MKNVLNTMHPLAGLNNPFTAVGMSTKGNNSYKAKNLKTCLVTRYWTTAVRALHILCTPALSTHQPSPGANELQEVRRLGRNNIPNHIRITGGRHKNVHYAINATLLLLCSLWEGGIERIASEWYSWSDDIASGHCCRPGRPRILSGRCSTDYTYYLCTCVCRKAEDHLWKS